MARSVRGLALGAGIVLGWVLCDLSRLLNGGEPGLVMRELGPDSLVAVAIGALAGAVLGGRRWLQGLALAGLLLWAWTVAHQQPNPREPPTRLPWALGSMVLVFGLASLTPERLRRAPLRLGLAFGAVACTGLAAWQSFYDSSHMNIVAPGLVAAGLAASSSSTLRRFGTAAVLAVGLALVTRTTLLAADLGPGDPVQDHAKATKGDYPNLLLIVWDTVRADHLASYGYGRVTTPTLDAYAREEATLYQSARSTSPYTLSSHASLFTGLYPSEHGATVGGTESLPLRGDVTTLAERLGGAGFRTGAIFANVGYLNRKLGFHRGFEHFDDRFGTKARGFRALVQMAGRRPRLGDSYRDAERITDLALAWLGRDDERPFFLALNYMDAHTPLSPPEEFVDTFRGGRPWHSMERYERLHAHYDAELLFLDAQLRRLLEWLRGAGLHDRTLVVLTSDHGEAFGERDYEGHCWFLYEEQLRVPLIVKPPGGRSRAVVPEPITGADVHDLVLRELGLEPPVAPERPAGLVAEWYPWTLSAKNRRMAERLQRDLTTHQVSWTRGPLKTIVYSDGSVEVFDLDRDPLEQNPLDLTAEDAARAIEEARAWWEQHPAPATTLDELDEEFRRALLELGYG